MAGATATKDKQKKYFNVQVPRLDEVTERRFEEYLERTGTKKGKFTQTAIIEKLSRVCDD